MGASTIGAAAGFVALGPVGALAGFGAGMGKEALDLQKDAVKAQERLEQQRRDELSKEAAARRAAAAKAAKSGSRAGGSTRSAFMSSLGFGSGNTNAGLGMGTLFGN